MSRTPPVPTWWKNTYFWIAAILFVVAVYGLIRGSEAIRDPGQKREDQLVVLIYLAGAVVMLVNGLLSHRQTVMHYHEVVGVQEPAPVAATSTSSTVSNEVVESDEESLHVGSADTHGTDTEER